MAAKTRAANDEARSRIKTQEKLLPPGVLHEESTLGTQDAAATEAELNALSQTELSASHDPERILASVMAVDYGEDGDLLIRSLLSALSTAANTPEQEITYDPIFKHKDLQLSSTKTIALSPNMRRTDGKYRANQLEILTASNPASFHNMILRRRGMC
eukprot:COSAG02_NODE_961_length_15629_cov_2.747650_7_plen_158_part_00